MSLPKRLKGVKRPAPTPLIVETKLVRQLGASTVVVIPIRMRELLGIRAGDVVRLTCDADQMTVEKEEEH